MIDIVLATYNGEKYIRQQLDSLINQSYSDFKLLISDDCSTDRTVSIIESYIQKDNRIVLFQNEQNIGFLANFEQLIKRCECEYVAFCDQDDIWTANHLEILLRNAGDNFVISGNALLIDKSGKSLGNTLLQSSGIDFFPEDKDIFKLILFKNYFQGTAMLAKTSYVKQCLPIPKDIKYHDYWFALKAASINKVTYVNEIILLYRQHGNNVTSNSKWSFINRFKKMKSTSRIENIKFHLQVLNCLMQNDTFSSCFKIIDGAYKFYSNLYNKKQVKNVFYFFKNYKFITGSKKKKYVFPRLLKLILVG